MTRGATWDITLIAPSPPVEEAKQRKASLPWRAAKWGIRRRPVHRPLVVAEVPPAVLHPFQGALLRQGQERLRLHRGLGQPGDVVSQQGQAPYLPHGAVVAPARPPGRSGSRRAGRRSRAAPSSRARRVVCAPAWCRAPPFRPPPAPAPGRIQGHLQHPPALGGGQQGRLPARAEEHQPGDPPPTAWSTNRRRPASSGSPAASRGVIKGA